MDPQEQRAQRAERRRGRANTTKTAPKPPDLAPFPCSFRSPDYVGTVKCSCSNAPKVYSCSSESILSGFSTPEMPSRSGDGVILFRDGRSTDEKYMPYPLRDGETPRKFEVICCSSCPHRREPPAEALELAKLGVSCQSASGKFDLLHVLEPRWDYKGRMWTRALPSEIQGAYTTHLDADAIKKAIEIGNPAVVVFHALIMPVETVREMAESFPKVSFVNLFHSSQNGLMSRPSWISSQIGFLRASQDLQNVFYATPDPRTPLASLGWERAIWWPNVVQYDRPEFPKPEPEIPNLLITGRFDIVKGIPASFLAAGIVQKRTKCKVTAIIPGGNNNLLRDMADSARADIEIAKEMSWEEFHKYLWESVTVSVCSSAIDAYPHSAWDSLCMGVPVIGSKTITFLDDCFVADHNSPLEIAEKITQVLGDIELYSKKAAETGDKLSESQQKALVQLTNKLTCVK